MNEQPLPPSIPTASIDIDHIRHTNKLKFIWGLICLIAPTALLVVSILAYALINFIASTTSATPAGAETLVAESTPIWQSAGNIILFLVGGFSAITWLPGIIGGIILLSTRKQV